MTKDELLKYAKENYPVGTKYKCPRGIGSSVGSAIHVVKLVDEIKFRKDDEIDIIGKGYIYYKGKWAEILEKPKVETKFEKGKWYKILDNWYGKFETVHNSGKRIKFSEYITSNGTYIYSTNNIDFISEIKPLTNLSEIQQYLPDGHPDKFTTSIAKEFVLPKHWFLRFKTKEVFDELCAKYFPEYIFYENAGICNNINEPKLGNYYYLSRDTSFGEEITFEQFKKYILNSPNFEPIFKENINKVKEEVKPIERWSVDSYIVALENCCIGITNFNTGDIAIVLNNSAISLLSNNSIWSCDKDRDIRFNDVKWFPTLQEAQKFSDELLGKSKTGLRVEDLVEGEIYVITDSEEKLSYYWINMEAGKGREGKGICVGVSSYFTPTNFGINYSNWKAPFFRLANPPEKKWLKTCIKQDKFIEQFELDKYDDEGNLMESVEIPEYIKYLGKTDYYKIQGVIYKVISWGKSNVWVENNPLVNYTANSLCMDSLFEDTHKWEYSNKESYEEQFKKDDKFKNGDWLVYIEYCGCNSSTPIKIGDIRQMIEGRFGSLVIYGTKDLSQYFRKALPNEIPTNTYIKEKPKLVFPYKVGDRIRCIKLNTWADTCCDKFPVGICECNVVEITKVGDLDEECECIPFAATYDGVEYGFSYSDDNKYELVESFEDFVSAKQMEFLYQIHSYPVNPEECYLNKQEVKNPLDDSEREVNINFSKPKQIKFL